MKSHFKQHSLKLALLSAFAIGASATGVNSYAATANGTANATVVNPIAITAGTALNFGSFSTSAASQTVTIAASGGTRSNSGTLLVNSVNAPTSASFSVTGDTTLTYAITLPSTANIAIGAGTGTSAMTVSAFTSAPSATGTLTAGAQTLTVGATVTTVADQVSGSYTGTFPVTVAYN